MTGEYNSVPLNEDHDVARFDCGNPVMNTWLAEQANRAQKAGTARTWVWTTDDEPTRVWAYYSLAPTAVDRAELTGGQAGGYSGSIPGYLLARLALYNDLRGHGYGGELLVDALTRAYRAAAAAGGRLIVVDAIDEAAVDFYKHHDFTPVKGNPRRLVLKVANVAALLGPTGP